MKKKKWLKITMVIVILIGLIVFLRIVLSNTAEVHQHNIGTSGNKVYVHKNGHYEMVIDQNGKKVKDDVNMGSYNYAHPVNEPFKHLWLDTIPWIKWGNTENDPTSIGTRLHAFGLDLYDGFKRTIGVME